MAKCYTWKGMEKLEATLKSNLSMKQAKALIKYHGAAMQERAKRKAPVKTGFLRNSIELSIEDDGLTAVVKPYAEYAEFVEYGVRKRNGKPFMAPAFHEQKALLEADLKKLIK